MRTVDDFAEIRRLHRDKLSIRAIATQLGIGRDTVRKALRNPEPVPYTLAVPGEIVIAFVAEFPLYGFGRVSGRFPELW